MSGEGTKNEEEQGWRNKEREGTKDEKENERGEFKDLIKRYLPTVSEFDSPK